jgi:hypothetical protein
MAPNIGEVISAIICLSFVVFYRGLDFQAYRFRLSYPQQFECHDVIPTIRPSYCIFAGPRLFENCNMQPKNAIRMVAANTVG